MVDVKPKSASDWSNVEEVKTQMEYLPFWLRLNINWFVYGCVTFIFGICVYFYFNNRRRQAEIQRQASILYRAQRQPPQKRRPGAAYRDHQIYRHTIKTVYKYLKRPDVLAKYNLVIPPNNSTVPATHEN